MLSAGFSVGLARKLVDRMPAGADVGRGLRWTKAALQAMLNIVPENQGIVSRGGVYALVGPTGVGKTTTVAKLAAQATLRFGANHVALITTDTYRVGAVDQLKIYGKILGVPVISIRDESDMRVALGDLRSRRIVLIDTIGMGQRDRRLVDQVALLCGDGKPVQRLLLLSAVAQADVLAEVVNAYKGTGMAGCILTKLDESLTLGGALDVLIRHKLPLFHVTNGQRVPEDLHLASPLYLVERAIRLAPEQGMFAITEEDVPYLFAESAFQPKASSTVVQEAMRG
jgi:flagellar biosynthesis protein FlhF